MDTTKSMLVQLAKKTSAFINRNITEPNTILLGVTARNALTDELQVYARDGIKVPILTTGDNLHGLNIIIIVDIPEYFEVARV